MVHVLHTEKNLVVSRCCFTEDGKKCTKTYYARAQPLSCSLNLLFRDVPVTFAVAVFLNFPVTSVTVTTGVNLNIQVERTVLL